MSKIIILSGYGLNCERETKEVIDYLGGDSDIVHINDLISKKVSLNDYKMIIFPGGFSFGDDIGSGKAFSAMIKVNLMKDLEEFKSSGGIAIGICNGFQIMSHLGIFSENFGEKNMSLLYNKTARYICKWVTLKINEESNCIFTKGIKQLEVPIAHGEGNFYADEEILEKFESNNQIVAKYKVNPNGSSNDIAAICDKSGKFFGLMPHPERASYFHNLPNFPKLKEKLKREGREIPLEGPGIEIFKNAINHLNKNG